MRFIQFLSLPLAFAALLTLAACSEEPAAKGQPVEPAEVVNAVDKLPEMPPAPSEPAVAPDEGDAMRLLVHKSETCGCCALWVDHLVEEGVPADVQTEVDMESVKTRLGVPEKHRSCHTAVSRDGYVFEGHVPALAVRRFLKHTPEGALGLAVPGMPVGSPGMEVDQQFQPYQIILLMKDGSSKPYGYVSNYESQFEAREPEAATAP